MCFVVALTLSVDTNIPNDIPNDRAFSTSLDWQSCEKWLAKFQSGLMRSFLVYLWVYLVAERCLGLHYSMHTEIGREQHRKSSQNIGQKFVDIWFNMAPMTGVMDAAIPSAYY